MAYLNWSLRGRRRPSVAGLRRNRALQFENLESRLAMSAQPAATDDLAGLYATLPGIDDALLQQLTAADTSDAAGAAAGDETAWASTRGLYVFSLGGYKEPWAPGSWDLAQWESWLDTMQFLHLNHLQLPRAPWSERPGLTAAELAQEELWIDVLQAAKARGMTTSIIFSTTFHGDPAQPWRILSPGSGPQDPNWQTLVSDYQYWAGRYGQWVDEWLMGVEDPGGSPSSSGLSWPYETPSPLGDPSYVSALVGLELEMRTAAQAVNPNSRVVGETWGLRWWGTAPGYTDQLQEFLALVPSLPADMPLSTHADDDALTNQLQATGRDVDAWPFYLLDHEFPSGHTKLHFSWIQNYLRKIKNQGIDDVVAHVTHPMEQLPSLYVYSRMLEDTEQSKTTLLRDFASLLVSDTASRNALANAISNMGLYWDSVSGPANWDAATLQPVNSTAPYAPRYTATQLNYINTAYAAINSVTAIREVSQIPMQITAAEWVKMLKDQIKFVYDAAYIGTLVQESATYLDNHYTEVVGDTGPFTRADAQVIIDAFHNSGSAGALAAMEAYLKQFSNNTTGQNHPLGIIYDFLRTTIPTQSSGLTNISGDFLEYDAPSFAALFKYITGWTDQTDPSFSYLRNELWFTETSDAYSGGTAIRSSTINNEVNIIFAGSGVSLIHSLWSQGAVAAWSIDGGAGGSGTINMNSATRQDQVETLLASGLANTLHVLTIKKSGGAGANSILVDAINVLSPTSAPVIGDYNNDSVVNDQDYNVWKSAFGTTVTPFSGADGNGNGVVDAADYAVWRDNVGNTNLVSGGSRLRRENDREMFNYTSGWVEDSSGTPSDGSIHYTLSGTSSLTVPFNGTAIAIAATTRADYGVLRWSIDGGAGGTGTINLAATYNTNRKPFILTTALSGGSHTLTITKQSGFLVNIDAIDTFIPLTSSNGSGSYSFSVAEVTDFDEVGGGGMASDLFVEHAIASESLGHTALRNNRLASLSAPHEGRRVLVTDLLLTHLHQSAALWRAVDHWSPLAHRNSGEDGDASQLSFDKAFGTLEVLQNQFQANG